MVQTILEESSKELQKDSAENKMESVEDHDQKIIDKLTSGNKGWRKLFNSINRALSTKIMKSNNDIDHYYTEKEEIATDLLSIKQKPWVFYTKLFYYGLAAAPFIMTYFIVSGLFQIITSGAQYVASLLGYKNKTDGSNINSILHAKDGIIKGYVNISKALTFPLIILTAPINSIKYWFQGKQDFTEEAYSIIKDLRKDLNYYGVFNELKDKEKFGSLNIAKDQGIIDIVSLIQNKFGKTISDAQKDVSDILLKLQSNSLIFKNLMDGLKVSRNFAYNGTKQFNETLSYWARNAKKYIPPEKLQDIYQAINNIFKADEWPDNSRNKTDVTTEPNSLPQQSSQKPILFKQNDELAVKKYVEQFIDSPWAEKLQNRAHSSTKKL